MPHFYLRVTPGPTKKIVISVSKKVSKKAVVRNRIRRRIRPMLKELTENLKPANYFIVANPGAEMVRGKDLQAELIRIIRSIRN